MELNETPPHGIPKVCGTCKYGKSPCDWCFYDPDGADNWVWDGKPWPRETGG